MANAEAWFNNSLHPRKPEGSLGRTAQDGHLDSHTAPEICGRPGFPVPNSPYGRGCGRIATLNLNTRLMTDKGRCKSSKSVSWRLGALRCWGRGRLEREGGGGG